MHAGIFLFFNIHVVKILKISIFNKYFLEAVTYRFLAPKLIRKYGIELILACVCHFLSQENSVVGCQFSACVACLQGAFL